MDIRIILLIPFLLTVAGSMQSSYGAEQNSTLDSEGNYANPSLGIAFHAPPGWTVQEPKKSQPDAPDIAVIAPYSTGFTASVSLSVEYANGTSLEDYVKNNDRQLGASGQAHNLKFISEQDASVGGFDAKASMLEENFTSKDSNNLVMFKQVVVLANDKFYTITYANDKKDFDSDLSSFDQMLGSIKFENSGVSFPFDYLSISIVAVALAAAGVITARKRKQRRNA